MAIFIKDLELIEVINKRNLTKLEVDSDIIHFINYQNTDNELSDLKFELDTNFRMSFDKNRLYFRELKNSSNTAATKIRDLFVKFNTTHKKVFENFEKVLLSIDEEEKKLLGSNIFFEKKNYTTSSFEQAPKKIIFDLLANYLKKTADISKIETTFVSSHKLFNFFILQNNIQQTKNIKKLDFYKNLIKDNNINFFKNFLGFNFLNVIKENNNDTTLIQNKNIPYSLLAISTAVENVLHFSFDHMTTNSLFFGFYEDEEFQNKFNFSELTNNIFVEHDITKELIPIKFTNNYSLITKKSINNLISQINYTNSGENSSIISQRNSNEKIDTAIFEKLTNLNFFKLKTQDSSGLGIKYTSKMIPENDKKLELPKNAYRFLSQTIFEALWGRRRARNQNLNNLIATYTYREENFDQKVQTYVNDNYDKFYQPVSPSSERTIGIETKAKREEVQADAEALFTRTVNIYDKTVSDFSFNNDYAKVETILRTHNFKTKQSTLQALNILANSLHSKNVKLMYGNPGKEITTTSNSVKIDTSEESIKYYDINDDNNTGIFNFDLPYMVGSKSHETISSVLRNRLICNNVSKKYKKLLLNKNTNSTKDISTNKLRFLLKQNENTINNIQNISLFQNENNLTFQTDLTFIDSINRKTESTSRDIIKFFQNENHLKNIFRQSDSLTNLIQNNDFRKIDQVTLNQEFLCRNKKIFGESNLPDYLEYKHNIVNLNKENFEDKVINDTSTNNINEVQRENLPDFNNLSAFIDEYYDSNNLPKEFKTTAVFFESITELCKNYIEELLKSSDSDPLYSQDRTRADLLQSAVIFKIFLDNYYNSSNNENTFNNEFLDLIMSDMMYSKYGKQPYKTFKEEKYQKIFNSNTSPIYQQEQITSVSPFHIYFTNEDQKVQITNGSVRRSPSTKNAELIATNGRDENYNSLSNINIYETNGLFTHFINTDCTPVETQALFSLIDTYNSLNETFLRSSNKPPLAGYNILENYQSNAYSDSNIYRRYVLFVPTISPLSNFKTGYQINVKLNYKKDYERSNQYIINSYLLSQTNFKYSTSALYDRIQILQNTGLTENDKNKDIFYKIMSLFSSLFPSINSLNQLNNNDLNSILNTDNSGNFFREIKQMLNDTILLAGEIYLNMFYKMQGFESVCRRIHMSNTMNIRSPYVEYKANDHGFPSSESYRKEIYSFFFHNLRRYSQIGDKRLIENGMTSDVITGLQNTPWNRGEDIQYGAADDIPSWLNWKTNFTSDDKFADVYLEKTLKDSSLCIRGENERHTNNIDFEDFIREINSTIASEDITNDLTLSLLYLPYSVPSTNISIRKMLYLFNEIFFDMKRYKNSSTKFAITILKHLFSQNIPLRNQNNDGTKKYHFSTYHLHSSDPRQGLGNIDLNGSEQFLTPFLTPSNGFDDPTQLSDIFDANVNIFEQFNIGNNYIHHTSSFEISNDQKKILFYNYSSLNGFIVNNETAYYNIFNVENDGDRATVMLNDSNDTFGIPSNATIKFLSPNDICNSLVFSSYNFENKEYSIDKLESNANITAESNEKSYGIDTLKTGFETNLGLKELSENEVVLPYINNLLRYSRFADINESWYNHIVQGLLINDLSLSMSFDFLLYYKNGFFNDLKNKQTYISSSNIYSDLTNYSSTLLKSITLNKTDSNKLQKLFLSNRQNNKLHDLYLQSLLKHKMTQNIVDIITAETRNNQINLNNLVEKIIKQNNNNSDYTDKTELFFNYFDDEFIRQLHLNKDSINNIHNISRTNVPVMTSSESLNGSHIITVGIKNTDKTDRDDIFSISVQLIDHDFPDIIWEPKIFEFHSSFECPDNFVLKYLSSVNSKLLTPLSNFEISDNNTIPLKIFKNIEVVNQNEDDNYASFKDALIKKRQSADAYPNLRNNIDSATYQTVGNQFKSVINPIDIENDVDRIIEKIDISTVANKIVKQFNRFNQLGNTSSPSINLIKNLATDLLKRCIHNQKISFKLQKMIKLITGFEPTIDFSSSLSDEQRSILNGKYILREIYDIYIGLKNTRVIYGFSREEIDLLIDKQSSLVLQIPENNDVVLFKVLMSENHSLNVFLKFLSDFSKAVMLENRLLFGNLNTFEKIVNVAVNPKDFIVAGFSGSGVRDFIPTSPELTFRKINDTGIYLDEINTEPNKILRILSDFTVDNEKIDYYEVFKDGVRYVPKNVSYRISTTILK